MPLNLGLSQIFCKVKINELVNRFIHIVQLKVKLSNIGPKIIGNLKMKMGKVLKPI